MLLSELIFFNVYMHMYTYTYIPQTLGPLLWQILMYSRLDHFTPISTNFFFEVLSLETIK